MNRIFTLTLASLCSLSSAMQASGSQCDWTMVNQDLQNSRSSNCTSITFNDVTHGAIHLKWARPGPAVQAPAVVQNGIVYYGDTGGTFYAVDSVTGNTLHSFVFPNAGESVNGPAIVTSNRIYATTVSAAESPATAAGLRLYAFDLNLTPVATFNGGQAVDVHPGFTGVQGNIFAGPVLIDNIIMVATSNSTPEETTTINPTYRGGFQAFDVNTGVNLWRTAVSPANSGYGAAGGAWSTAAVDKTLKLMFVGTTNATTPPASPQTDAVLAIDYTTGVVKWSQQFTKDDVYSFLYSCGGDFDVGASPNLFTIGSGLSKKDVVGCGSKFGVYRVFERKTGKPVWSQYMIPKSAFPSIDGSPTSAYADGKVYTVSNSDESGVSYNGLTILAQYGLKAGNFDAIGVLVNALATTDQTFISAMDAATGKVLWSKKRVSATLAAITEANHVLYTGNFVGELRALDTTNGAEFVIATVNGTIGAPVTVVNNQLFVGYGLGGPGGFNCYEKH